MTRALVGQHAVVGRPERGGTPRRDVLDVATDDDRLAGRAERFRVERLRHENVLAHEQEISGFREIGRNVQVGHALHSFRIE